MVDDIALTLYERINPRTAAHLISCFGSARAVFNASRGDLTGQAGLRDDLAGAIVAREHHKEAEREAGFVEKNGYKAIAATSEEYPKLLKECGDHPHVLYVEGDDSILQREMITMVGTREITSYGQVICDQLVRELSEQHPDLVIVSGLAYGVDAACNRAALKYGMRTIAVMGTPINKIYPSQHTSIARDIVRSGGVVMTEIHSRKEVHKNFFARRNRIMAGLSPGSVIVESPPKGGSLITADLAHGYDRSVMAVPGRANDWASAGTNALIKSLKAQMVCSGRDIFFEMGWEDAPHEAPQAPAVDYGELGHTQRRIMECFAARDVYTEYELCEACSIPYPDLCEAMFVLECRGLVRALSGGKYEKTG